MALPDHDRGRTGQGDLRNGAVLMSQDCRVRVANCLGREGTGFITAMKTFDVSRPGVGAQALGIA